MNVYFGTKTGKTTTLQEALLDAVENALTKPDAPEKSVFELTMQVLIANYGVNTVKRQLGLHHQ